jgi:DNA ligase-1
MKNFIFEILQQLKDTPGSNDKLSILKENEDNELLKRALKYGVDTMMPFHVVKVPKVKDTERCWPANQGNDSDTQGEKDRWEIFFDVARGCAARTLTGNAAIDAMHYVFRSARPEEEFWMRKILKKHLAIGVSSKTLKKAFPDLIQTFELALANKFHQTRLKGMAEVAVEPKLDGIRCFSIVRDGEVQMFARSGKLITNFESTLAPELIKMGDGCYDGELMGEDFISLMRQAYRKDNVDTSETYLALFDYLPLKEWDSRDSKMTCENRYEELLDRLNEDDDLDLDLLRPVERDVIESDYNTIKDCHDEYVKEGYEGAMIKDLNAPYKFGRGWGVMKFKAFHDADLPIKGFEEGTGKHLGKLGAIVVDYKGVTVKVGSGFSDDLRERIWDDQASFVGRIVEIRYQEVTPDGSLRFPTFVCFRNDRK